MVIDDWPGKGLGTRGQCCSSYTFTSPCWQTVTETLCKLVLYPQLGFRDPPRPRLGIVSDV